MQKSERLLNLLILLLVQRRHIGKARIRALIEDYRDASDEAFERMFERDKGELRALGVPVETGQVDGFFEDEPGYRIPPDEFALPGISLTADEAAVLGLATRVWRHAGLAAHTSDALAKLAAAGVEVDPGRLDLLAPAITADEPTFDGFWQAALDRQRVSFDHQRAGAAEVTRRTLEPWGLVCSNGRWYVVGRDLDRDAERMFRLSRVRGKVAKTGRPGAYRVPEGLDLRAVARRLEPGPRTEEAILLVRRGAATLLRRGARILAEDVTGPDREPGWDRLVVATSSLSRLADDVLAHGTSVVAEAPEPLVTAIVGRLDTALADAEARS